nr:MAG TPA: secretion system protein [Bacteriophage sp.]
MEKMKIIAYGDEKFSKKIGEMTVQISPLDYQGKKEVKYDPGKQQGQNKQSPVFVGYKNEELSVDVQIDCTGVIEGTKDADTVKKKIGELEKLVYKYNGDGHQSNFIEIAWGTLLFKGRLKQMKTTYGLFAPDGQPLRAKVTLLFTEFVNRAEADKEANRQSPDMSHMVALGAGDTIALLCQRIYGDSGLADEVARINGLNGFRNVKPGTVLLFPHLMKNG